ncbi:hypothetical protein Pla22_28770 [Rubripirellula amarantea]|uniref:Uncharacterized protein n=1 Tax=Rubripirellula amarantea TaxID=2527999 RepID=A0A5C5WHU9_9BACT|nr:hypothetical protein Pla22_28770 [Rubripirellula amarantea]
MPLKLDCVAARVKTTGRVREVAAQFNVVKQLNGTGCLVDCQVAKFACSTTGGYLLVSGPIERQQAGAGNRSISCDNIARCENPCSVDCRGIGVSKVAVDVQSTRDGDRARCVVESEIVERQSTCVDRLVASTADDHFVASKVDTARRMSKVTRYT